MAFIEQIVEAVRDGAIILTANQRLSRTLRTAYDQHRQAAGLEAWESPAILPFGSWLRARWSEAMLAGAVPAAMLLSRAQEETLWRDIIQQTPESELLLDVRGAASSAMQAWRLVHQYRLPIDGRFGAHEDWAAFAGWAASYRASCAAENWLDEARLPDAAGEAIAAGAIEIPPRVLLAGFDELTPQQSDLLDRLSWVRLASDPEEPAVVARSYGDQDGELRGAAEWARDVLRGNPEFSIGVVLLNLGLGRERLERIFGEALHPERMQDPAAASPRRFHISIPDALSDYPLVDQGLLALRLAARQRWPLAEAGRLLRSPFVRGSVEEGPARAAIDARLRRKRRSYVGVHAVEMLAASCPALAQALQRWTALASELTGSRLPSGWIEIFRQVLEAAGWPGDRVLSSAEYQVLESWYELLRGFAALDCVSGPIVYGDAVAKLAELAGDTQFQPLDPGAPVQIMGALEAAGARFDALWICGATDETWPAPAHPHPFLPLSLQRERRLPHSSPDRESEFAARIFARLRESANTLVVSWPGRAGDVELRPSPFIAALPTERPEHAPANRPRIELEQIADEAAPALRDLRPRGGTAILRLQSRCPFQAFGELRLGARPLEVAELGLSPADRGSAIHDALRLFWEDVRDHATLVALSDDALHDAASQAVIAALARPFRDSRHEFDRRFREIETSRLTEVLIEWAVLEKSRSPFQVAFSERERTIRIGGLDIDARIDRVDELPGGGQVILDYKATAPSAAAWYGDRPDEPQLPLYAISNEAAVAGVAFAQVGPEGLKFKGFAADPSILPSVKTSPIPMDQQLTEWRRVLEPIADSFRRGAAAVDPKDGAKTCEQCGLMALCRIYDAAPEAAEDLDAAP